MHSLIFVIRCWYDKRMVWVGNLPRLAYIFTHYMLGRKRPFLASFKLTYRCNLGCLPCPFHRMQAPELSYAQVTGMLDRLHARGNRMLVFEGGEPLLWRDGARGIHDAVAYARRKFYSVGITTNGTLPLDVDSDILWVSIDGFAGTHNRLRGADVFERVMTNIQRSAHPRLFAHITINRENAAEVPALIRFMNERVRGITVQFYYPYQGQDELFLDFGRRAALLDEIIALKRSGLRVLNSVPALRALKGNTWKCRDHLIDCANPDGSIAQGCYLKTREDRDCSKCGFSPHTEISLACQGNIQAILAGAQVFFTGGAG